jgi:hypothetical protein
LENHYSKVETMKLASLRLIVAPLFATAVCLAVSSHTDAARYERTFAEQLVATAVSAPDAGAVAGGRIDIAIERWSTDEERESLRRTLTDKDPFTVLARLGKVFRRAGVVQMPGAQGVGARARTRRVRNLKFAQQIKTPTGRQVILVADQHLGFGESGRDFESSQPEFTLLDIRIGQDGKGVGKLAPAAKVTYNQKARIFEVENYASQPVRLRDVRSENK